MRVSTLYNSLLKRSSAQDFGWLGTVIAYKELSGPFPATMGSRQHVRSIKSSSPLPYTDDIRAYKKEYAEALDAQDTLRCFRDEFIIPSKKDLKRKTLALDEGGSQGLLHVRTIDLTSTFPLSPDHDASDSKCIYFCGNSLGVQPHSTQKYIEQYLRTWAMKGVTGHFVPHDDQLLPPFVDVDSAASKLMAPIVGANQSEVAVMGTLTANLHLLMASFYCPTKEKYKIILEGKAFPSDHVCRLIYGTCLTQLTSVRFSMRLSLSSVIIISTRMKVWF